MSDTIESALLELTLSESNSPRSDSADDNNTSTNVSEDSSPDISCVSHTQTFHPLYSEDIHNSVVLETQDGVLFRVAMDDLSFRFSFFRDMFSIPASKDEDATDSSDVVIPLTSATSEGLACILAVVTNAAVDPTEVLGGLKNAIELARFLDAEELVKDLWDNCMEAGEYFMCFTMAVLIGDEEGARKAARRSLALDYDDFPPGLVEHLHQHHSNYLARLERLHRRWQPIIMRLKTNMRTDAPVHNGFMHFGSNCNTEDKCSAYSMVGGNFAELRKQVADIVVAAVLGKHELFLGISSIRPTIEEVVRCPRCTTRLQRTFWGAMKYLQDTDDRI